jgi:hypothetical protein
VSQLPDRYWIVQQGASMARVRAADYAAARERAKAIGFSCPASIVLEEADREARKRALEACIALFRQMERRCYNEAQKLDAELQVIEDAEADEDERRWNALRRAHAPVQ